MFLQRLGLQGFRNCTDVVLEPAPGLNVLHGANAQGKTNILEGIALLTALASFRSVTLRDLIQLGGGEGRLRGDFLSAGLVKRVELVLREGQRLVSLDGASVRSSRALQEHVRSVVFTGDDLRLITGSPSNRRRFLDRAITTITPDYGDLLREYNRILTQKNALLSAKQASSSALIDVWNLRLCACGARIAAARLRYVRYISAHVQDTFSSISNTDLAASLVYCSEVDTADVRISALEDQLADAMAARRSDELRRGTSLVGPHLDDLSVLLTGQPASRFASQGQLRMLAMSLKLAELWSVMDQMEVAPIFLLDDVSSELDAERNRCLMDTLRATGCQLFVTTTSPQNVPSDGWEKPGMFQVAAGSISAG